MPSSTTRAGPPAVMIAFAATAVLLSAASGCQSGYRHSATNLPAELRAPLVENVQTADLSRFAGPAVGSDRIAPGDVLEVSFAASLKADDVTVFRLSVDDAGTAVLPEIGPLRLAGLRTTEAEQQIVRASVDGGLYRQPQVSISMLHQRANRITVVGGVNEPGVHEVPRGSSYLFAAIAAAEGLSEDAGPRVEIRQPDAPSALAWQSPGAAGPPGVRPAGYTSGLPPAAANLVCLNLTRPDDQPVTSAYLQDGSVVTIEKRQPRPVEVVGLVNKPDRYDFPPNHELRVLGAISLAQGVSSKAADNVIVLRRGPNGQEQAAIQISLRAAKQNGEENLRLAPGDIVSVEQTPATLLMELVNIVRFGVGATMPLF